MDKTKIREGLVINDDKDGNLIIFDYESGNLIKLNSTAKEMFRLLEKGLEKEDIVKKLSQDFNKENEKISEDFDRFLADLKKSKIVG